MYPKATNAIAVKKHIRLGLRNQWIAQADYKQYHDRVIAIGIYATFLVSQMGCNHKIEKVVENDDVNILWDFHTQTNHQTAKSRKKWENYKIEQLKGRL